MSRTLARVTQADVARAIRAAKQAGAGGHHLLGGMGVWRGYGKLDLASGEKSGGVRSLHLKIQAGCRGYGA